MKKLGTILIVVLIAVGLAALYSSFFGPDDSELRAAEKERDDAQAAYDALSGTISDSLDRVRAAVIDSLAGERQEATERIVYVQVEREPVIRERDSSMVAHIEALSIDAPHLVENAQSIQRQTQRSDSLFRLEIAELRRWGSTWEAEANRWMTDFETERDARLLAEGVIAEQRDVEAILRDQLDAATKLDLGLFKVPKWVGYAAVGGAAFYAGTRLP